MRFSAAVLGVALAGCTGDADISQGPSTGGRLDPSGNHYPSVDSFGCDPSQGVAPLTSTCSWAVSSADAASMSCAIDVNADGTFEYTFPACPNNSSQDLVFNQSGTIQVLFQVIDARGLTTTSTVSVTVTGGTVAPPGDQPPVISQLSATPSSGFAPLAVQLAFSVSDPDGDATTCTLTEGSQVISASSPCGSNETRNASFAAGAHTVTLTVDDGRGGTAVQTTNITATVNTSPATGDLSISKVEWGQSVIGTAPRLVAGKDALLRVYVLATGTGMNGAVVKVDGKNGSTSLGELTLTGPGTTPTAEAPSDLSQQWHIVIPGSWVSQGFSVAVHVDPNNQLSETNETNNDQTLTPTVGSGNVLPLTAVPVAQGGHTGVPMDNAQGLKQIWPLKDITVTTRATYTSSDTLGPTTNWDTLLSALDAVRMSDGSARDYVGWVHLTYSSGIYGIGYVGDPTCLAADSDEYTSVHELGHNMNRNHAPCGGATGVDPNYPVSTAHLDTQGWDYVSGNLEEANVAYDIMAYCDPQWVSTYNYKAVQTWLEENPVSSTAAATASPRIIVSGTVIGDVVTLKPLIAVNGTEALSKRGEYAVTVRGGDQTVTVPFMLKTVADLPSAQSHFTVLVPDLGSIDGIEISRGGRTLVKRLALVRHVGTPKVAVIPAEGGVSLRWDAKDYAYASLTHVSSAGGRTTLSLWREDGEAFVSTQGLPEGGAFEVSLSDGVATKRLMVAR